MDCEKHRTRMWLWLIANPEKDLCDIPFKKWLVKKASQEAILKNFVKFTTTVVERNESSRGDTTKLLIELQDGHRIETVIMRHVSHSTVCVSSQIGCQMGCRLADVTENFLTDNVRFYQVCPFILQVLCHGYYGHNRKSYKRRDIGTASVCKLCFNYSKCGFHGDGRASVRQCFFCILERLPCAD